ncbi:MAG: ABC transporter ATP-binding protein [Candidatus Peribacteria bacterium]|nr:MAG: ABC transporter ATP-binding protein [Candidatus Peribacteria bacterium]
MFPLLAITTIVISSRIRKSQQKIVSTSADLAGSTTENIRNVTLIKSL